MATFRCRVLSSDHVGRDSAAVCRRGIADKTGYVCPRKEEIWIVHETCFNLKRLMRLSDAEMEKQFGDVNLLHATICGTGKPDTVSDIKSLPEGDTIES